MPNGGVEGKQNISINFKSNELLQNVQTSEIAQTSW